jgi:type II secretory pathway component PulJ
MQRGTTALLSTLLAASALVAPQVASAQTARQAELEARLAKLEQEMQALKADLVSARSEQAATATQAQAAVTTSTAAATKVAALEAKPPVQQDGFRAGSTTIKVGGYIKLLAASTSYSEGEVATNSLGRDFYLPQAIPTGTGPASTVTDFTAKQSRFWVNFATDISGHTLKGYVEADFQTAPGTQGSQRTTNGYNPALRRAFIQFDKWGIRI